MALVIRQVPRGIHTFPDGTVQAIRGLTRAEAIQLREIQDDVRATEKLAIQLATDSTPEEVEAWYAKAPQQDAEKLVDTIAELSGLNPDVGKEGAEASLSAKLTELITSLQKVSELVSQPSENSPIPK